jgi:hypothetical protein
VLDVSGGPYAPPVVLGTADFDLAEHADLDASAPARSKQLRLPRAALRRGDAHADTFILIQMTITSRWQRGDAAGGDESAEGVGDASTASGTSSSGASSLTSTALTHETLQAFDASQPQRGVGHLGLKLAFSAGGGDQHPVERRNLSRSHSYGRFQAGSKSSKVDAGRVAELSQLMAGAAADARQAESRLATLQFRLKAEVRAPDAVLLRSAPPPPPPACSYASLAPPAFKPLSPIPAHAGC